jgi:UDP-hydrolysing UDP-N-acetyl-D-glucosamine 2-epimerase
MATKITKNIVFFVSNRANYSRLEPVIQLVHEDESMNMLLITASEASENDHYIKYPIAFRINSLMHSDSFVAAASESGNILTILSNYLDNVKPAIAICRGDRYEVLAFAVACSYLGIKLIQDEAFEISGNIDDKVRNCISILANIKLCPSAKSHMRAMMFNIENVYLVGSTAIDNALKYKTKDYDKKQVLALYNPVPSENVDDLVEALLNIKNKGYRVFWVNANHDPGNREIHKTLRSYGIEILKNISSKNFLELLARSCIFIGNSSSGIKEAGALEIPYILVGNRQAGREIGSNVIRCTLNKEEIINKFEKLSKKRIKYDGKFGKGDASSKIFDIIVSNI